MVVIGSEEHVWRTDCPVERRPARGRRRASRLATGGCGDTVGLTSANRIAAAAGTDSATETADIALMTDDLSKLPWLIAHSRRMLSVIRGNVAFVLWA